MIRTAGLAVLFLVAWTQTSQADFSQEIRRCDSDDSHPDIRIVACTRNIQSGRFIGRNLAVAFANRGKAYKRKGQLGRAIADYSAAIRLKSDDAGIIVNRGNAYYYQGQYERAIKDFDAAIRLSPELAEAYGNRGNVYRKQGRFDRAIKDYDRALQLTPDSAQVFADRGLAYEKKGEASQALRDFKNAHALGFRHPLLLRKIRQLGTLL